jgi:hypothetical protein
MAIEAPDYSEMPASPQRNGVETPQEVEILTLAPGRSKLEIAKRLV